MSAAYQRERIADIVRPLVRDEIPRRSLYGLIALNLALLFVVIFVVLHVQAEQREQAREAFNRQQTQDQWNASLKGQIEGLTAAVELGPRMEALAAAQERQNRMLDAIANRLGIVAEKETDP